MYTARGLLAMCLIIGLMEVLQKLPTTSGVAGSRTMLGPPVHEFH